MITVQSPATENHLRPKSGRRPLLPIRSTANLPPQPNHDTYQKPDLKLERIEISHYSNKENLNSNQNEKRSSIESIPNVVLQIDQFEVSLADELSAMREKTERLKSDKEKTEKMMKERESLMEMKMKEFEQRGEIQKVFEIEVDRLYRLKELRSLCNRIVPIRSLREKEVEKIKPDKSQGCGE